MICKIRKGFLKSCDHQIEFCLLCNVDLLLFIHLNLSLSIFGVHIFHHGGKTSVWIKQIEQ